MTDAEYAAWLASLKPGDEVTIANDRVAYRAKVIRVTPSGKIVVDYYEQRMRFGSDGWLITLSPRPKDGFSWRLRPIVPGSYEAVLELLKQWREEDGRESNGAD